jgi:hypothetical protein
MSRFAEDRQDFKDAVNQAISIKLTVRAYTLHNITEASFSKAEKEELRGDFYGVCGGGDRDHVISQMVKFDLSMARILEDQWFETCLNTEIENQILILRSDRDDG